jgi:hypothetical protein
MNLRSLDRRCAGWCGMYNIRVDLVTGGGVDAGAPVQARLI